jgi:hypothetical protein
VHALELSQSIRIQDNFDALLGKPSGPLGMSRIDRADTLAAGGEKAGGGLPRAGEPDDQEGPTRQRRSHFLGGDQGHHGIFATGRSGPAWSMAIGPCFGPIVQLFLFPAIPG